MVIGYLYSHRNEGSNSWSTSTHAAIRVLFGLVLGRNLLQHTGSSLSVCLQRKSLSAAEGQAMTAMTIRTLKTMTADDTCALFWKDVTTLAAHNLVNVPVLPRRRRLPARYLMKHRSPDTDTFTLTLASADRSDQHDHNIYMNCEGILLKTAIGEDASSEFDTDTELYGSDSKSVALNNAISK